MTRLGQAIALAALGHMEQVDKGGEAYILHPIAVMNRVRHLGESHMIVAALHDYLEDCYLDLAVDRLYLKRTLPAQVVLQETVLESLTPEETYALECLTKREGEKYADAIERVCTSPIAMAIKEQDLIQNLDGSRLPNRAIEDKDLKRWMKYRTALDRIIKVQGRI